MPGGTPGYLPAAACAWNRASRGRPLAVAMCKPRAREHSGKPCSPESGRAPA